MSNLISNRRAASRGSETPCQGGNVAGTSTLDLDTTVVPPVEPLGPTVSTAAASLTSSVTHHVLSAQRTHRRPRTSEEAQPSGDTSSVHGEASQIGKKKNKDPCRLQKTSQTTGTMTQKITIRWDPRHRVAATKEQHSALATDHHYELSNLDSNQMEYINNLCSSRFTQWKSDLHKHYELYDGLKVALEVECPIELLDRRDEWEWLCGHFQDKKYFKKVKANSINRSKKKLIHRSRSRRFSYRLEERRKGGQSFLKLTCSMRCTFGPGMS